MLEGYSYVITETTELRRVESQLRATSRTLSTLTESAAVATWTINAEGRCTFAGEGWSGMLGHPAACVLGHGWVGLIHQDDRRRAFGVMTAAVRARTSLQAEMRMHDASGDVRWVLVTAVPRFAQDRVVEMAASSVDITARRRAEDEQGALLRIAVAAARGDGGRAVAELAAAEACALLGLDCAVVVRFGAGDARSVGGAGDLAETVGARMPLEGAIGAVRGGGRAVRALGASLATTDPLESARITIAAPIRHRGHVWGAIVGETRAHAPLVPDAEAGLSALADLLGATAALADLYEIGSTRGA